MDTSESLETTDTASSQRAPRAPKRRKPDSGDSPEKGVLTKLPGDICGHCKECCTETGEQGKAVQCDLCGVWVHARYDGISVDQCTQLVSLTSSVENIAYLCKLNSCQSCFKQLIFKFFIDINNHDDFDARLEKVEAKLDEIVLKVGSELESYAKIMQSLPSSNSVVEIKVNEVVQEFGTRLDSHR